MNQPVRSMTGYGRAEREHDGLRVDVELRSVNHRFLELNLNLPRGLGAREAELRAKLQARIRRGRVDVNLNIDRRATARYRVAVNRELVAELGQALEAARLAAGLSGEVDIALVTRFNEVVSIEAVGTDLDDVTFGLIDSALDEALEGFDRTRLAEGTTLIQDLRARIEVMLTALTTAECAASGLPEAALQRLKARVVQLLGDAHVDPERLATELALMADRIDVTEEVVRLRSHLERMVTLLDAGVEVGKGIDFLLQEAAREANTLGVKARGSEVSDQVLVIKGELEKVREQARNLE